MKCDILSYAVPMDNYANSGSRAMTVCRTHGLHDIQIMDGSGLCPVGKVEKAVEDGLAKIENALRAC